MNKPGQKKNPAPHPRRQALQRLFANRIAVPPFVPLSRDEANERA